ncbi:MAG: signal peptidase II [Rhodoglobus sp.]
MPETDEPKTATRPRVSPRALALLAVVAALVYVFDRVSKYLVTQNLTLGVPVEVLGQLLQFHYVENPGAAFSLGSGSTWIFAIIATAVTVVIIVFARRIRSIGWAVLFGLLLGGTLGNLTDRLTREPGFGQGYVVDFLQIWGFPAIFNIADVGIVSSMGLFIILTLRGIGLDGTRTVRPVKVRADQPTDDTP